MEKHLEDLMYRVDNLTERRGPDRHEIVRRVCVLCEHHGVGHRVEEDYLGNKRSIAVHIVGADGLGLTFDVDGTTCQPDTHVLSWHFSFDLPREDRERFRNRVILPGFAQDRNSFHKRKATDICCGTRQLLELLDDRLSKMAGGLATAEKEVEPSKSNG